MADDAGGGCDRMDAGLLCSRIGKSARNRTAVADSPRLDIGGVSSIPSREDTNMEGGGNTAPGPLRATSEQIRCKRALRVH
jgi:hypothetical protein